MFFLDFLSIRYCSFVLLILVTTTVSLACDHIKDYTTFLEALPARFDKVSFFKTPEQKNELIRFCLSKGEPRYDSLTALCDACINQLSSTRLESDGSYNWVPLDAVTAFMHRFEPPQLKDFFAQNPEFTQDEQKNSMAFFERVIDDFRQVYSIDFQLSLQNIIIHAQIDALKEKIEQLVDPSKKNSILDNYEDLLHQGIQSIARIVGEKAKKNPSVVRTQGVALLSEYFKKVNPLVRESFFKDKRLKKILDLTGVPIPPRPILGPQIALQGIEDAQSNIEPNQPKESLESPLAHTPLATCSKKTLHKPELLVAGCALIAASVAAVVLAYKKHAPQDMRFLQFVRNLKQMRVALKKLAFGGGVLVGLGVITGLVLCGIWCDSAWKASD